MFKILYKDIIIDILKKPIYCRYFPGSGQKLRTDATSANCIISSDGKETYHLSGRSPAMPESYKSVRLIAITANEYDYLQSLIVKSELSQLNLGETKMSKIAEMSTASEQTIHAGTNVSLSNGENYHFSFSDQDQFQIGFLATAAKNAAMLESMGLSTGETGRDYPWHADGGDCVYYSRDDMITIGTTMLEYIQYHNSYFHALRNYINELTNPVTIADLYYGVEVPRIYWGEVYAYVNT